MSAWDKIKETVSAGKEEATDVVTGEGSLPATIALDAATGGTGLVTTAHYVTDPATVTDAVPDDFSDVFTPDSYEDAIVSDILLGSGGVGLALFGLGQLMPGGPGHVDAPEMSPEEEALQAEAEAAGQEQLAETEEMDAYFDQMMPNFAHAMQYSIDDEGNWNKMTDEEWYADERTTTTQREQFDLAKQQRQIQSERMGLYRDEMSRYQKALRGELPLSEATKQQKQEEFELLKAQAGIVGETPETAGAEDTLAIQRLNAFNKKWRLAEDAERRGQVGQGMGGLRSQTGYARPDMAGADISRLTGIGGTHGMVAGAYGDVAQTQASLQQPYQFYNMMGYEADQATAANRMAILNSLITGGASILSGATSSGGGMAGLFSGGSSREYKKDIKKKSRRDEDDALKKIRKTKSYSYKYKPEMGLGDETRLGSIAEETPDEITTPDKKRVNFDSKIELVGMGIKSLARKLDRLERRLA